MGEHKLKIRKKSINSKLSIHKSTDLGDDIIPRSDSVSNNLLKFTSYQVIKKFQRKTGGMPRGVYFNKAMSLTHRILKEEHGIDIGLPHYWYRYGDQIHKKEMPRELEWNHESPFKTTVNWKGDSQPTYQDETYKKIQKIVQMITEKYAGKNKQITKEVYQYAPYDFQRRILECWGAIHGWRNALNWDAKSYQNISKPVILRALDSFPTSDFPNLKVPFHVFKTITEQLLDKDDWDFNLFSEMYETFWFWFCYYLRLKNGARENIPHKDIAFWESRLDFENTRFRRIMGDLVIVAYNYDSKILNDKIVNREYSWRIKDLKETEQMLNELNLT